MAAPINHGLDQVPRRDAAASLEATVRALMPLAKAEDLATALDRIQIAIDDYRESFPILENGRRHRGSLKQARRDLRGLVDGHHTGAWADLPLTFLATQTLLRAGQSPWMSHSARPAIAESAALALERLASRGDHEADPYREVFACEVARTLQEAMGLPVSMTRDDPEAPTPSSASAAYARLLRAGLKAAGGAPPKDLLPLMRAGMAALNGTTD